MIYEFGEFQLDRAKVELRAGGRAIALEPQVFALLLLLVEHADRVVSKDEIIEKIWDGRIVSDAAVASRVKSARQAVGDDGEAQALIRTVRGHGFRFVGEVRLRQDAPARIEVTAAPAPSPILRPQAPTLDRPSIAVLPFRRVGHDMHFGVADALPDDIITELSRLRWLFVIARGSSFRFRDDEAEISRVRDALSVRYCLSGSVEIFNSQMMVSVELSDTETRGVIWSDRFRGDVSDVHEVREEIAAAVIGALEMHIPLNEAQRARLKAPDHLDAWAAYHLGLHHMYRFTKEDNARATGYFERAAALEPTFARAYAGLSFTHFQNAFLRYSPDIRQETNLAHAFAEQALEHDPLDAFGSFTMGRSRLLHGDLDGCREWLLRATTLSPNFAQAKYSKAWTEAMLGSIRDSRSDIDTALALSPLDPLRYAMLSVRAFSHIVAGEFRQAAEWADRSAHSPGAHVLIEMIAVFAHGLDGNDVAAQAWARSARARQSNLSSADFLRAFPFRDAQVRRLIIDTLARYGF
ncbi:MAG TPA: winged helix-turn-helix domain-containing protein [Caulobacterales bacterium]|nr:winged helix-turn-helix domain-containing protein [Caulobacterales bacterium]